MATNTRKFPKSIIALAVISSTMNVISKPVRSQDKSGSVVLVTFRELFANILSGLMVKTEDDLFSCHAVMKKLGSKSRYSGGEMSSTVQPAKKSVIILRETFLEMWPLVHDTELMLVKRKWTYPLSNRQS